MLDCFSHDIKITLKSQFQLENVHILSLCMQHCKRGHYFVKKMVVY